MRDPSYIELVKNHYRHQAREYGAGLESTMLDRTIRRLEMTQILSYLEENQRCFEAGCGNGALSLEISRRQKLDLTCIDFLEEFIEIAERQSREGVRGSITFRHGDILSYRPETGFDAVFTVRCLINILDWDDQKKALSHLAGAVKGGGRLILLEGFTDGLKNLNSAREEVGLAPIKPAFHNLLLDKERLLAALEQSGMKKLEENNFLSTYFFASRVLYPALARAGHKTVQFYNSAFARFFADFPPSGNTSHIKILVFEKP